MFYGVLLFHCWQPEQTPNDYNAREIQIKWREFSNVHAECVGVSI